ncbi:hypothetical protein [Actinomadura miaoliensis]|uniref:Uncharacterized protein n=1 Tax=Actinomadura miaoliensis TaxID=430685 RepID=A0ABP7WT85_9ACTN
MHCSADSWIPGPFDLNASKGSTVPTPRKVLAVAHHITAATRLADVLPLLESDRRVAVAYTAAPASIFTGGLEEFLRGLGGVVLPWRQATQLKFDLAIAASHGMLENLHAPVMTVAHGSGPGKLLHRREGLGPPASRPVTGLIRERLVVAGRVVPSSIAMAHERHQAMLERECPEALPVTFVAGDPCLDRLMVSLPYRDAYRRALGVEDGQQMIFLSSTWDTNSLLGQHPDLLLRVTAELPSDEYRIVAALHPHVWAWYGRRQVTSWYADCLRLGLRLLPPEEGWRAALVAADRIVGDHGSVTCYGAALGVPVLLGAFPEDSVAPGSHTARLGMMAARVDWDRSLRRQLDEAVHSFSADAYADFRRELSSRPGEAARLIRREMYRLMRLPDRQSPPRIVPVPLPRPITHDGIQAA